MKQTITGVLDLELCVFGPYRRTTNRSFFFLFVLFLCSFSNTSSKCQVLFWAPGLFTGALSQADLHDLFEIVRVFTCSTPELPPLTGLLEPEAVIVPCTAIKGPILVLMRTFLPFAPSVDGVSHLPLLLALPQATHTPVGLITPTEERSS